MAKKQKAFDALKWVELGAAKEANRPVLTYAHYNEDTRTLASADGFRLFVVRDVEKPESTRADGLVSLKKSAVMEHESKFPDYASIIPDSFSFRVAIDIDHLRQAVKLAQIFSKDNNQSTRFDFYPSDGVIRVFGRSLETGDCETVIAGAFENVIDARSISMSFNARFILDAIKGFEDDETITFNLCADWRTLLLIGDPDTRFAIVMAMATSDSERHNGKHVTDAPALPAIEPRAIGYRAPKPSKPRHSKSVRTGDAGGNARNIRVGGYDYMDPKAREQSEDVRRYNLAIARTHIEQALNESAQSHHGQPVARLTIESGLIVSAYGVEWTFTNVPQKYTDAHGTRIKKYWRDEKVVIKAGTEHVATIHDVQLTREMIRAIAWDWHKAHAPAPAAALANV